MEPSSIALSPLSSKRWLKIKRGSAKSINPDFDNWVEIDFNNEIAAPLRSEI